MFAAGVVAELPGQDFELFLALRGGEAGRVHERVGHGFAGVLDHLRLGVKENDVRRPATHHEVDDALGLGLKVRAGQDGAVRGGVRGAGHHGAERDRAEAERAALQEGSPGHGQQWVGVRYAIEFGGVDLHG